MSIIWITVGTSSISVAKVPKKDTAKAHVEKGIHSVKPELDFAVSVLAKTK